MSIRSLLAVVALLVTVPAQAQWISGFRGNDTGGIIPWSPDTEYTASQIAGNHCASYNKVAVITSVHRVYGDYIGFICAFPRGYDPVKNQSVWWTAR